MKLKNFKIVEIVILGAVILTWLMKSLLKVVGFDIEIVVLCSVLSIMYMFFSLKLFGKTEGGSPWFSIVSGIIYSIGIISVMMNALSLGGKEFFLIPSLILLLLTGLGALLNKKKEVTSGVYWNTQLLRCFIVIILNAIYLL